MPTAQLNSLKSRVWVSEILRQSQLTTPYALESFFSPPCTEPNGTKQRSSRWHRYQRGETSPSSRTVDAVEARLPGTAVWIHTPLWKLMNGQTTGLEDVADVIGTAKPHLARHTKGCGNELAKPKTIDALWRQGDLTALSVLLGIARHAEITGNLEQYVEASRAASNLAILLSSTTALLAVRDEFLDVLWARFFYCLKALPPPATAAWSRERSIEAVQSLMDEAFKRERRFGSRKERALLAFWVAKKHPLFLMPPHLTPALALDQYEKNQRLRKRYSAPAMNVIQRIRFDILCSPPWLSDTMKNLLDAAEGDFLVHCQNHVLPDSTPGRQTK